MFFSGSGVVGASKEVMFPPGPRKKPWLVGSYTDDDVVNALGWVVFVFETIDNAEQSFRHSRHDKRMSTIL